MTGQPQDTPSLVDRVITRFRGGQPLRFSELTALEKREYLFEDGVRATAYTDGLPDVHFGVVQFAGAALNSVANQLLSQTLTRNSDELDPPKLKLFHSFGSVAKVRFTPAPGTPFTGIFREEAHGLARFSYAGPVVGIGIVPGLALKFPRDGPHPSADAVVMRMLDGQERGSVFEHVFTNILPAPQVTNIVMQVARHRFETVVEDGRGLHQPVDDLASASSSGTHDDGEVQAPYQVIFVPTDAARQASNAELDFRVDLARHVPNDTTIYDIFGVGEAEATAEVEDALPLATRLGTLTTESEFIASSYGDYRLFFKHSDVFLRPELAHAG